jgi:hypothetical protein
LSRVGDALREGSATEWESLGLDRWLWSPKVCEIAGRYPGLADDLRNSIAAAFSPKGRLDLSALMCFPDDTLEASHVRIDDERAMNPFPAYYTSPREGHMFYRDHILVFLNFIEVEFGLTTPMPTDLGGLLVDPAGYGGQEVPFLVTRDTLARTDFDALMEGVPERDDFGKPARLLLRQIFDILELAKADGADVVAWIDH